MRSILVLLLSTAAALAEPRVLPVDEGASEKNFSEFRASLLRAVEKRGANALESLLAPDALANFGDERGEEGFQRTYGFRDSEAPFWPELEAVLRLGGCFTHGRKEFTAPYVAVRWPEKFDPFEYVALTGKDVVVRARADAESKELARLSYSILPLASETNETSAKGWVAVNLPGSQVGFVPAAQVRSPLSYRAQFRRVGSTWKLVSFIAGD